MSEAAPAWALTLAYWLHMLATVLWIGGLVMLALVVIPSARKTVPADAYSAFLGQVQSRLQSIGWFSLAVLGLTGMFQMSSSPFYNGFLAIDNTWSWAILIKHLAIGLMVLFSIYATWGITPALRRLALLQSAGKNVDSARLAQLHARELLLLRLNLVVSVIVLALTAIARSA